MFDSLPYDALAASRALANSDHRIGAVIARVGPPQIRHEEVSSVFSALLRSIVYQQLSGKAAGTIHGRVAELMGGTPAVDALAKVDDQSLRNAGMSWAKIRAARDLAEHIRTGSLPNLEDLESMADEAIIENMTAVRGIGPWTVQMLLIFRLGRPDVWPNTDLGIRKGVQLTLGLPSLPDAKEVEAAGTQWRPWRSVAAWYMWRALDLAP